MRKFIFVLALLLASTVSAQTRPQGGTQVGPVGGGGGGASAIDDLTDVTVSTPASGQVLYYNGSGWINSASPTLAAGTITTSQPVTITQTWNEGSTAFTAFFIDLGNMAFTGLSTPIRYRWNGADRFSVFYDGGVRAPSYNTTANTTAIGDDVLLGSAARIGFTSNTTGTTPDVYVLREAAAHLGVRNSTTAQKLSVSGTWTDASNYRRAYMTAATGAPTTATFGCETAGTAGANCDVVISPTGTGSVQLGASASVLWTGHAVYTGALYGGSTSGVGFNYYTGGRATFSSTGGVEWSDGATNSGTYDVGIFRSGAGVAKITNGSTGGGAVEFLEQTAPAAGAANTGRLFAQDNGSGKTQLCARFATGAVQCFATEP